jgi:outer membrane immunogenic protein
MKSLHLAAIAGLTLTALPAAAFAQDTWDGWYVGANIGGASGSSRQSSDINSATNTYFAGSSITSINADGHRKITDSGVTGGLQVGFNAQSGGMVWGVEADFDALDINKSSSVTTTYPCCGPSTYTQTQGIKTSWMFTARPRVGFVAGDWLVYGTGGVAVADVKATQRFSDNFTPSPGAQERASSNRNRTGWVLGGGVEHGMSDGWSLKAEYLYADFGKTSFSGALTNPTATTATFNDRADLRVNIFRVGVNKRF